MVSEKLDYCIRNETVALYLCGVKNHAQGVELHNATWFKGRVGTQFAILYNCFHCKFHMSLCHYS